MQGKTRTKLISSYNSSIRNLINSRVQRIKAKQDKTILTQIKEQLGLQLEDNWGFLCTSMDLIEDSNLAIENFAKFQLEGPTKYNDEGEKYLRLYGFLNAVHIQQNALVTLFALLKVPGKDQL